MNRLDKYIKQIRGISYNPKDISEIPLEDYLPILKANNIQESSLDISNLIYIHKSKIKQEQLIKKGDLLLAASSGSKDIVGKNVFFENDFNGSFGAFCKVIRPNENIYPKFLSAFFKTPIYRRHIRNLIQGANINNLRNEDINSLKIPVFSRQDQIRIANFLSKTEDIIKQRKESVNLLDAFLKSTFLDMFGDPVLNTKSNKRSLIGELTNRIVVGHVGPTSEGYSEVGIPFLRTQNVRENFINYNDIKHITKEFYSKLSKSILNEGDVLISRVGVNRGMAAVVPKDLDKANCANVVIVGKTPKLNPMYLSYYFNLTFGKKSEFGASVGSAQGVINTSIVKKWPIILASLELQNKFAQIVESTETLRVHFKNSLQVLENLSGSLSQRAFKGELTFKTLENEDIEIENFKLETKQGFREIIQNEEKVRLVEKKGKQKTTQVGKATLENYYEKDIANLIRQYFTGFDFRFIDLIKLLEEEKAIAVTYNTTEELKRIRGDSDEIKDLQTFIFDCVQGKCKLLKLKQWFHDAYNDFDLKKITIRADKEEIRSKLLGSPPEMNIEEFHGIYFKIIG